jgi:hypothetical protein
MQHSTTQTSSKSWRDWPRLLAPRRKYSAEEVRFRLQVDWEHDERTAAVHAAAARTSVWSSRLPDRVALDLGRSATRLPTVVYWHRQGISPYEIGRRLSPFGTEWDADRALAAASGLIAEVLNQGALADLVM